MAIVCQSSDGWLLDHKQFIDGIYAHCDDLRGHSSHPSGSRTEAAAGTDSDGTIRQHCKAYNIMFNFILNNMLATSV